MKIGFYMNALSAHQLPLAREVVRLLGAENFVYVTAELQGQGFQTVECIEPWVTMDRSKLDQCDLVLTGMRDFEFFERRRRLGLKTFYTSERWFKPISIGVGYRLRCALPGWVRMLVPGYRKMARRFARWLNADPHARYLAIGPWAKRDALRMGVNSDKIIDWGYFVAPSTLPPPPPQTSTSAHALRVLWVGRMIRWKCVDTIIKAVTALDSNRFSLTLIGDGEQRDSLAALADGAVNIMFKNPLSLADVRSEMRRHDVYVLSSNGEEGWGAALNEALEEGMCALGTYEAGASAALLSESTLFHAGDWRGLAKKLSTLNLRRLTSKIPNDYTAQGAAERLLLAGECV